jgi:flagellar motor switch/type III secretory pathway protein FliN
VIAEAQFTKAVDGVRALRFWPRSSIPLEAACVVANGLRETLRELFGETCELVVGEPCAVGTDAWRVLAHDALLFLTRGRQTDIVLVIPRADARRLVLAAFGETAPAPQPNEPLDRDCSALELQAIERIAARCAPAFDPLCAERRSPSRPVAHGEVPRCAAYFDVRVHAPAPLVLGVAIVRALPDPGPAAGLSAGALDAVPLTLRVVFATGRVDAGSFLRWRTGDVVPFDTTIGSAARLDLAGRAFACGAPGRCGSRAALRLDDRLPNAPT